MRPPLRLDIGWCDLVFGAAASLAATGPERRAHRLEASWSAKGDAFCCLSVRTGLDLYLSALELPEGSEVLVSAYTIPDMVRILEHHGLVCVPVDLDPDTLAPPLERLAAAVTEKTRAILIAHLFGSRIDLGPIASFARAHGLVVLEDGAQVFDAEYKGHDEVDISMFSFGTIKTATALGGALLRVKDAGVLVQMQDAYRCQPEWSRATFLRKVFRTSAMKLLSTGPVYGFCVRACGLIGKNHEDLHRSARGFRGPLIDAVRHRPCAPLIALMQRRLDQYPRARIENRERNAERILSRLPDGLDAIGSRAATHTHWVVAILASDPRATIDALRAAGFDATQAATATVIERDGASLRTCKDLRARLVYVPCDADFGSEELDEVVRALGSTPTASRVVRHEKLRA